VSPATVHSELEIIFKLIGSPSVVDGINVNFENPHPSSVI